MSDPSKKSFIQYSAQSTPHPVRQWWDQANEQDQDAVLANLYLSRGMAGVPWAFLPDDVRDAMSRQLRIKPKTEG